MFRHRALINRLVSVVLVCSTAFIGDRLVVNTNTRLGKALSDNLTHGVIGALTWATTAYFADLPHGQGINTAVCTALAMLIDMDHFLAARSFQIKDATSLTHRPPLHCTSLPIALCALGYMVVLTTRSFHLLVWICITGAAFFSHHFRDSARRGLWLWPFGSTSAFHPLLYFSSIAILPHVLALVISQHGYHEVPRAYSPIQLV